MISFDVVFSMEYTKSVDYWSLGLLCHEIATGQRPFLPNLSPGQWMDQVRKKSPRHICLTQDDETGEVVFHENLLPINYLTKTVSGDLEAWLRLLLEWDPQKRGKNEVELTKANILLAGAPDCSCPSFSLPTQ